MFSALAAAMAVRRRGLPSGSPPPLFAAMVISLIRRVNILPRLASSAPFLCLIVAHFEWPDMVITSAEIWSSEAAGEPGRRHETHENKVDYSTARCYDSLMGEDEHSEPTEPVMEPAASISLMRRQWLFLRHNWWNPGPLSPGERI